LKMKKEASMALSGNLLFGHVSVDHDHVHPDLGIVLLRCDVM
jgi:hypothetical protein